MFINKKPKLSAVTRNTKFLIQEMSELIQSELMSDYQRDKQFAQTQEPIHINKISPYIPS